MREGSDRKKVRPGGVSTLAGLTTRNMGYYKQI